MSGLIENMRLAAGRQYQERGVHPKRWTVSTTTIRAIAMELQQECWTGYGSISGKKIIVAGIEIVCADD